MNDFQKILQHFNKCHCFCQTWMPCTFGWRNTFSEIFESIGLWQISWGIKTDQPIQNWLKLRKKSDGHGCEIIWIYGDNEPDFPKVEPMSEDKIKHYFEGMIDDETLAKMIKESNEYYSK